MTDLQVPKDSLDLALNSVYVHSKDTLVPKMYTIMQPETLGQETWRVLKNEIKVNRCFGIIIGSVNNEIIVVFML